jgi:uncharacterized membrane protein
VKRAFLAVFALVAIAAVVAVLAPARPAAAKSFEIVSLDSNATVNTDATMDVHERVVYHFSGGTFTVGIRTFAPRSQAQIVDFEVREGERSLPVTPPSQSISGGWEWQFPSAFDENRTFDISYHVERAVTVGTDVGELYWQFIGTDHPGVGNATVTIDIPGNYPPATATTPDSDTNVVRAWAHGPRHGSLTVSSQQVVLNAGRVPAATFVEARVAIPSGAFTVPPTSGPRLPTILKEERHFIDHADRNRLLASVATWALPFVLLIAAVAFVIVWFIWGKEPKTPDTIGDYWREPLDDPPAVTNANLAFGTVGGGAFAATVVDLAQRGFLTINEETIERFGPDRTTYTFTWTGRGKGTLTPYEQSLLQYLFRGATTVTDAEFEAWARGAPGTAQSFWTKWKSSVKTDVTTRGYLETGRIAPWLLFAVIVAFLALSGVVLSAMGGTAAWLCWVAIIPLFLLSNLLRRRTPKGAEKAAEALALKRFLQDFSTLDEAPVASLVIWERYLVAAVALGVAGDLVRGLSVKVPEVANNPNFAPWYIGTNGHGVAGMARLGLFASSFGNGATSALSPSKSGSGGGFSGGGGGGGGGGGFGAR